MMGAQIRRALAAALLLTAPLINAQEPAAETQPGPVPIPFAAVPARGDALDVLLRQAEQSLVASPAIERVRIELPLLGDQLRESLVGLDDEFERHASPRALNDLRQEWLHYRARFGEVQATVDARWLRLQDLFDRLGTELEVWDATAAAIPDEGNAVLSARIQHAHDSIVAMRTRLRARLDDLLQLQGAAAEAQNRVSEVLERLQRRSSDARARRWQADSVPLWQDLGNDVRLLEQWRGTYVDAGQQIRMFFAINPWSVAAQLLLLILLAARLRVAGRRSRALADQGPGAASRAALSRPYSVALLVSLLAGRLFYEHMATPVIDLMYLLSMLPLLRVGSLLLQQAGTRTAMRQITVLFAMYLVLTPADSTGAMSRIAVILIAALAVLVLVHALRSRPPHVAVRAWLRFGVFAMAFSALTTLLGWSALGTLTADATLRSGYLALVMAVTYGALAAALEMAPQLSLGRYLRHIRRHGAMLSRRATRLLGVVLAAMWLWMTLTMFDVWDPLLAGWLEAMSIDLSVGSMSLTIGGLLSVVAILVGTLLVSRYVRFLLEEEVLSRLDLSVGERSGVSTVVHYAILTIGILMAASAGGLSGTQLTVVAGALGVGIGFGLQTIVSNFVSGLILIFERPVSVGDRIEILGRLGIVQRIGIRASVVRTYEGAEIIIPNAELISQQVVNWTLSDSKRRVDVPVGVAYGSDTQRVIEVLQRVAENDALTLDLPRPDVRFTGFGDSSLNFVVRCWVRVPDSIDAVSTLGLAIDHELRAAGIEIPFPQRDLHVRSGTVGAERVPDAARPPSPGGRSPA